MMKLLTALTAASALTAVAPAAAQYSQSGQYRAQGYADTRMDNRIDQLEARLDAGIQQGLITRREARPIRQQIAQLNDLERQYSSDGLSQRERDDLRQRVRYVRQQLRAADGGAAGRYANWDNEDGYNSGYVQNNGYGQNGYAQNNGYNQNGYYAQNNGYNGQGGPYEEFEACEPRTGIGGVIANVLGVGDNCGLRVGQRATGNLYGVPYQYQNQYRDGYGVYYRSDGRRIYQIDARTNTVVRAFPMQ